MLNVCQIALIQVKVIALHQLEVFNLTGQLRMQKHSVCNKMVSIQYTFCCVLKEDSSFKEKHFELQIELAA